MIVCQTGISALCALLIQNEELISACRNGRLEDAHSA